MNKNNAFSIAGLRDHQHMASTVADRVWNAWWRADGFPLDHVRALVDESLLDATIPFTLVALRHDAFLGTASVIESDLEERPQYSPWVAAVWVDDQARNRGIGSALVRAAADAAFALGIEKIFLCAEESKSQFYERMGWQVIERNVDGLNVLVMGAPTSAQLKD